MIGDIKILDEITLPQVGRYYLVPQLNQIRNGKIIRVPVHGPLHEDAEIIGFPHQHYHVDTRFMSDAFCRRYIAPYSDPFFLKERTVLQQAMIMPVIVSYFPHCYKLESSEPILLKRLCQRETQEEFPFADTPFNLPLSNAYSDCTINLENPICPHRGFKLKGLIEKDGVVICPGHGLRWNLNTGALVKDEAVGSQRPL